MENKLLIGIFIYWIICSLYTLWFVCNVGNKHGENSFLCMYRVITNQQYGSSDERLWIFGVSFGLGWLAIPYLLFNLIIWIPLSERHSEKRVEKAYDAKVEADRKKIITEYIAEQNKQEK